MEFRLAAIANDDGSTQRDQFGPVIRSVLSRAGNSAKSLQPRGAVEDPGLVRTDEGRDIYLCGVEHTAAYLDIPEPVVIVIPVEKNSTKSQLNTN